MNHCYGNGMNARMLNAENNRILNTYFPGRQQINFGT